ncbi:MAG TPA: right-handed parallel beta-helix repeat-containing protein, partial [Armatimonadota bacterium]|nr:right-handed parallel beta-helix repeat-containing protein [Armatimonadota bacterium]
MRGTLGFHALVALGVLLCVAGSGWSAPVQLFVAPDGRDTDPGTKARPFASLHRARDEIRKLKADGDLPNGATVLVGEGSYFLAEPLTFGPEDSGTAEGPITYSAAPGATVALRGSRPVTGWKPFKRDIYQTDLGDVDLGPSRFWQVFYKGARQPLARFPNFDAEHPRTGGFTYIKGTLADDNTTHLPYEPWGAARTASKTALLYDPERLAPEGWSQPEQARIHVWPWLNWGRNVLTVQAVDTETHTLILQNRASYALMEGNRFFVENVFEELDAPGEWYFDEGSKQLYFWPPDGKSPEGQVTVPVLNDLIRLAGDKASGRFVEHIRIHGFALAETHHSLVDLSVAAHCKISACALSGCGRTALSLSAGSHHNEIAGCDIAHVGNSAIVLAGVTDWTHTLQGRISHNLVTNNHVHDVGEGGNAWAAIAINPACGGNVTHDNVVSHNLVHDTPRQGINFNGFRNIVERNHVHHTNQEQSDTGAIGMGSRDIHERGSIIRHNYIHDAGGYCMLKPGVWEYPHYCWGVYLDDYTSGVHVYGNLIVRAQRGCVMVHGGQDIIIENNIIVDSLQQQVELMPIDSLTSGRTPAHPDKSEWLMTGTKILGNIIYYRADAALWARGSKWEQALAESDRNLIWHRKRPIAANLSGVPVEE